REKEKDRDRDKDRGKDKDGADKARSRDREERGASGGEEPREEGLSGTAFLVGVAIVLVLLAGFIGHWLGASSANRALVDAQLDAVKLRGEATQAVVGSLQSDLVGLLRATLGDEALHKPARAAIAELDKAIAMLQPPVAAAGSAAAGSAAPPAGAGSAAPAGATPAVPAGATPANVDQALAQLAAARAALVRLLEDRGSAEALLAEIERAAKRGNGARADLARDVAEQRAGLG